MAKAKAAQLGVGVWGRSLVAPILSCALIFSLSKSFGVTDLAAVKDSFSAVAPWQWLAAAVMTAISYWALGRYDATCHKWMKTGIHDRRATTAGAAALALSQTLGIGIITGALARWRMLPDLSLKRALLLSTNVAATFMAGWAVITVISLIFLANPLPGPDWLPLAMVAPALFLAALRPMGRLSWGNRFGLDAQRALMLCLYAGLDMLAAGIVVFVLIAPEAQPSLQAFLPAFLLALGAGLLSGTPGGVGAFELSLLALAPSEDPAALVAAILGYRLIYFALPAVIGAGIMVRRPSLGEDGQRPFVIETEEDGSFPKEVDDLLSHSSWAEAGLARQRDFGLLWCPKARSGGVVGMAGSALVMLRGAVPSSNVTDPLIDAMERLAAQSQQTPCFYKAPKRLAVALRKRGYSVLAISQEAIIDTANFNLDAVGRRQLRRKLRQADKAGLTIAPTGGPAAPWADMARVNSAWSAAHGGERGFSMGQFDPKLLQYQRIFLAWHGPDLLGFVTFHESSEEWALDLMRTRPDAPHGTMHSLVAAAIAAATEAGCPRVSLAAVPRQTAPHKGKPVPRAVLHSLAKATTGQGLHQFKACFAPRWEPLYFAAPTRGALGRCALSISRAIAYPKSKNRHQAERNSTSL